jgi:D-sedoheptulose 7-phosphate isomerase
MTTSASAADPAERIDALLPPRTRAYHDYFDHHAPALASLCHLMAERFARGGRLIAFGRSPGARSDARHVAVEFVHPVIVGKRALPAIGIAGEGGPLAAQVGLLAGADDIAIAFGADEDAGEAVQALALARDRGCLTIAFSPAGAEHEFDPVTADPQIRQELVETFYHLLWELVHIFFEHRGLLEGRDRRPLHDAGASSFLYPFLGEREDDLQAVLDDVRRSVLVKAKETAALKARTLKENRDTLIEAAGALRDCFESGGKLLALGNGGSATDAMDAVADFRTSHLGGHAHPALDLTEDAAILTAIANDVGFEATFSRQLIAYGAPGDVLLAFSTSGGSRNVIEALAEARRRAIATIAMVGYDGGAIAEQRLADHVIVTRSEHIPRIQEAQATALHALRAGVG